MWTYSIEYTEPAEGGSGEKHGSTMIAADTCHEAVKVFTDTHPPTADIVEIRRVRHD